ncbi:amidohydrolase family protein [Marinigracilibium pacificum]|uniref:Amidohydrolase family protein n=1 Tax=Marinigracilibium pacificum TaxID=2729599 RepID=A0A848J3G6_9BACT|nr:amidohydrolase family protein [Marinigracilibium pacificum]NMM49034.1 amidohydrolase family protein [Marinigracilibium pacificum]
MKNLIFILTTTILISLFSSCNKSTASEDDQPKNHTEENLRYQGPIIDMHMHAYDKSNPLFGEVTNPTTGDKYMGSKDVASHEKETADMMEKHNIVMTMISSGSHQVVKKWASMHPQKVIKGQIIINPNEINIDSLKLWHNKGELDIIGEVAPNYAGIKPDDNSLTPLFDLAEELEIPIAYHILPGGPPGGVYFAYPETRASQARPLLIEEHLVSHPKVKIYIMHAGWPFVDEMKALMYAHPQVYVDLGVISWVLEEKELHNFLNELVDAGFGKRIMFGSDQMTFTGKIETAINHVNSAPLTMEVKEDIFYNNAARFLDLSLETIRQHKGHKNHSE